MCWEQRMLHSFLQDYSQQRTIEMREQKLTREREKFAARIRSRNTKETEHSIFQPDEWGVGEGGNLSCRLGKNPQSFAKNMLNWFDVNSMDSEFWLSDIQRIDARWSGARSSLCSWIDIYFGRSTAMHLRLRFWECHYYIAQDCIFTSIRTCLLLPNIEAHMTRVKLKGERRGFSQSRER